jgi:hypothetical protein
MAFLRLPCHLTSGQRGSGRFVCPCRFVPERLKRVPESDTPGAAKLATKLLKKKMLTTYLGFSAGQATTHAIVTNVDLLGLFQDSA